VPLPRCIVSIFPLTLLPLLRRQPSRNLVRVEAADEFSFARVQTCSFVDDFPILKRVAFRIAVVLSGEKVVGSTFYERGRVNWIRDDYD
jgi:hypothetical protein